MSKKCKLALLTATIIVLALILAGCGKVIETPWDWVQNLSKKDIESAVIWYTPEQNSDDKEDADDEDKATEDAEEQKIELSEKDIDKLFIILYRLGESDFSEKSNNSDSTPLYGLTITMTDGKKYSIDQSGTKQGALEMKYADKMWLIDSDKLNEFIDSFLEDMDAEGCFRDDDEDKDEDAEYTSESDLEPTDISTYASDGSLIVQEEIDYSTYSNIG